MSNRKSKCHKKRRMTLRCRSKKVSRLLNQKWTLKKNKISRIRRESRSFSVFLDEVSMKRETRRPISVTKPTKLTSSLIKSPSIAYPPYCQLWSVRLQLKMPS